MQDNNRIPTSLDSKVARWAINRRERLIKRIKDCLDRHHMAGTRPSPQRFETLAEWSQKERDLMSLYRDIIGLGAEQVLVNAVRWGEHWRFSFIEEIASEHGIDVTVTMRTPETEPDHEHVDRTGQALEG